jgi:CheY-like chemotaxis protein
VSKILLVEDDRYKREQIEAFLSEIYPFGVGIDVAMSVNKAFRKLENGTYNVLILDMSLPNFDADLDPTGGVPINYGGEDIIDYVDKLGLDSKVIFISQYARFTEEAGEVGLSEIARRIKIDYPNIYVGAVYYNTATDTWRRDLRDFLAQVLA